MRVEASSALPLKNLPPRIKSVIKLKTHKGKKGERTQMFIRLFGIIFIMI